LTAKTLHKHSLGYGSKRHATEIDFKKKNCRNPLLTAKTLQKHSLGYGSKGHATEIDSQQKKLAS
jgi:hypothetical protein